MARLESTRDKYFNQFFTKAFESAKKNGVQLLLSAGLRLTAQILKKKNAGQLGERVTDGVSSALAAVSRILFAELDTNDDDTLSLIRQFPGFLAEYKNGGLNDIIPLQFQAVVTGDQRSAEFQPIDYGVNSLSSYKKTNLRKLTLETTFATLDQTIYTSHYVETKVRKLQSLLYPQQSDSLDGSGGMLVPPSLVGLYIGDKFMRRRLPQITSARSGGETLTNLKKALPNDTLNKIFGFLVTAEPIIWRVTSVNVEWAESPYNTNFSEFSSLLMI